MASAADASTSGGPAAGAAAAASTGDKPRSFSSKLLSLDAMDVADVVMDRVTQAAQVGTSVVYYAWIPALLIMGARACQVSPREALEIFQPLM